MRILLAEDEHALGEWLGKALEQSGFRVDWREGGGWRRSASGGPRPPPAPTGSRFAPPARA